MKIALLKSRARLNGGLEKQAARIGKAFTDRGHCVTLLTTGCLPSTPSMMHTVSLSQRHLPHCFRMERFDAFVRKWVKDHAPDVIFGMDRNRMQTHIRLGNGVHRAYLESRIQSEGRWKYWMCQINPLHRKILELEAAAFKYSGLKRVIVNSEMVKQEVIAHYSVDPKRIEVLHNGVEWKEMQESFDLWQERRNEIIQGWGLNPHCFQFLFIGNGYLRKGLDRLLAALREIRFLDFELSVVGKERNLNRYKRQVIALGLERKVRFFGPQKNISAFYQMADALVIPSFYDPFANVTIEALAMGLFVVSSKTNGGSEILNRQSGVLIEDLLSLDALKSALLNAMRRNKTKQSAKEIRSLAEPFDFSHQLSKLIRLCE